MRVRSACLTLLLSTACTLDFRPWPTPKLFPARIFFGVFVAFCGVAPPHPPLRDIGSPALTIDRPGALWRPPPLLPSRPIRDRKAASLSSFRCDSLDFARPPSSDALAVGPSRLALSLRLATICAFAHAAHAAFCRTYSNGVLLFVRCCTDSGKGLYMKRCEICPRLG